MSRPLAADELRRRIDALGPWFHNIDLHGVSTAPQHFLGDYPRTKWRKFAEAVPARLDGQSVLDVGCNGGFYSLEMKRRGASRVVGIDSDARYLAQARFAAEVCNLEIEFRELSVYDVSELHCRFDLVLFMGVLYHLRHPLLALDLLRDHVVGDMMVFQSMLRGSTRVAATEQDYPFTETEVFDDPAFPKMFFIEKRYAADGTNWWVPNRSCVEAMLRSARFRIVGHPEEEVYLCRPCAGDENAPAAHSAHCPENAP